MVVAASHPIARTVPATVAEQKRLELPPDEDPPTGGRLLLDGGLGLVTGAPSLGGSSSGAIPGIDGPDAFSLAAGASDLGAAATTITTSGFSGLSTSRDLPSRDVDNPLTLTLLIL